MPIVIAKEKQTPPPTDKLGAAGHKAEMQMAFYLRRAFGDDPDVLVFNDLRLVRNGEAAQIDHLVLHRFGFAIVESKSVVGELVVNQHGEFTRIWGRKREGMHSPIKQARLQAELLSKLLNDNRQALRRKVMFGLQQGMSGEDRFQIFAAISDNGRITRQKCDPPELCKADSVAEKIKAKIATYKANRGVGGFVRLLVADQETTKEIEKDYLPPLTNEELKAIYQFLLARDTPRVLEIVEADLIDSEIVEAIVVDSPPEVDSPPVRENLRTVHMPAPPATSPSPAPPPVQSAAVAAPTAQPALNTDRCKQCSGSNLKIVHGRYGYSYKCQDCDGNTPIDLTCTHCGEKARVTKSKLEFSRDCASCGEKVLFHVNAME